MSSYRVSAYERCEVALQHLEKWQNESGGTSRENPYVSKYETWEGVYMGIEGSRRTTPLATLPYATPLLIRMNDLQFNIRRAVEAIASWRFV